MPLTHQLLEEKATQAQESRTNGHDGQAVGAPAQQQAPTLWRARALMMAETAQSPEELMQFSSAYAGCEQEHQRAAAASAAAAAAATAHAQQQHLQLQRQQPHAAQVQSTLPQVFLQQAAQHPAQAGQPTLARTLQAQGHVVSSTSAMQPPLPPNTWYISTPERGRPGVRSRSTKRDEQEGVLADDHKQRKITRAMFGAAAAPRCRAAVGAVRRSASEDL